MVLHLEKNKNRMDAITDEVYNSDKAFSDLYQIWKDHLYIFIGHATDIDGGGNNIVNVYIDYVKKAYTLEENSLGTTAPFASIKLNITPDMLCLSESELKANLDLGYQNYLKQEIKSEIIKPVCLKTDDEIVDELFAWCKDSIKSNKLERFIFKHYDCSVLKNDYDRYAIHGERSDFDRLNDDRVIKALTNNKKWLATNFLTTTMTLFMNKLGYFERHSELYDLIIENNQQFGLRYIGKTPDIIRQVIYIDKPFNDSIDKTMALRKKMINSFQVPNFWKRLKFRHQMNKLASRKMVTLQFFHSY